MKLNRETGYGMVFVLMLLVVVSAAAYGAQIFSQSALRAARAVVTKGELKDLQNFVAVRMSCTLTVSNHDPNNDDYVIRGRDGQPILPEDEETGGMKMRKWKIAISRIFGTSEQNIEITVQHEDDTGGSGDRDYLYDEDDENADELPRTVVQNHVSCS